MKLRTDHWWLKFLDWCSQADRYRHVSWRGRTGDHHYPEDHDDQVAQ